MGNICCKPDSDVEPGCTTLNTQFMTDADLVLQKSKMMRQPGTCIILRFAVQDLWKPTDTFIAIFKNEIEDGHEFKKELMRTELIQ